jgi:hypothetical protein
MIPYIVALVFLIVIILYQVYAMNESFTTDASANEVAVTRDASANQVSVFTKDASGNEVRLSLSDLFGLLGPFKTKQSEPAPAPATDAAADATAPIVATPTLASTKEVEDRIAKAVSKQVKDDLMSQRSTDELYDKYAPCDLTDAEAQGQEFQKVHPRPSNQPDMSEYIRKDSIPCWNCSIP